jgi:hypothetical protein
VDFVNKPLGLETSSILERWGERGLALRSIYETDVRGVGPKITRQQPAQRGPSQDESLAMPGEVETFGARQFLGRQPGQRSREIVV